MNGPFGKRVQDCIHGPIQGVTSGKQRQRIEIALNWTLLLHVFARKRQVDHPIKSDRIDRDGREISFESRSSATGKANDPRFRNSAAYLATIRATGSVHHFLNSSSGKIPAQVSKI